MRIEKYTHSCVRVEQRGRALVIDPGIWSEPGALIDADAVLVTHEHIDHIDVLRLAGVDVPVYLPEGAQPQPVALAGALNLIRVESGETFTAAGFDVTAVGRRHATIYDGQPDCPNLGYVVDGRLYHPGDALAVPASPIEVLAVPMQASWLKTDEAIEFARKVGPDAAFGIHEGQVNERGMDALNGWLGRHVDGYRYLAPRESLVLDDR